MDQQIWETSMPETRVGAHMMDMSPSESFLVGQVREDLWTNRLVRLTEAGPGEWADWIVEDLLTGRRYTCISSNLSRSKNEMEAVAFVTAGERCPCCGMDGGRCHDSTNGKICGSCYRAACDTAQTCRLRKNHKEQRTGVA